MPKAWEADYPQLGGWVQTSDATTAYNCVAYVVEDRTRWWDPLPPGAYHWPEKIGEGLGHSLERYIALFESLGYAKCADGTLDSSTDKIVLYANKYGGFEHVAQQLPDGKWTSKLGSDEDITHDAPHSLGGPLHGEPIYFMARAKPEKKVEEEKKTTISYAPKGALVSSLVYDPSRSNDENPNAREDFTSLVNAAAQKQKPAE